MNDAMKRNADHAGFTLIEVMIASSLLAFEILAVLSMFSISAKSSAFSTRLTGSGSLAQGQLEKAKNAAYNNLSLLGGTECFDKDLQIHDCDGTEIYTRVTTVTANDPVASMSKVAVRVTWKDNQGAPHGTTLITSVSRF
jgi:Tfp pilus assembly protein PilV